MFINSHSHCHQHRSSGESRDPILKQSISPLLNKSKQTSTYPELSCKALQISDRDWICEIGLFDILRPVRFSDLGSSFQDEISNLNFIFWASAKVCALMSALLVFCIACRLPAVEQIEKYWLTRPSHIYLPRSRIRPFILIGRLFLLWFLLPRSVN